MKSLRQFYKVGVGPSSSHTMGPAKAAEKFFADYPNADKYKVVLFGSLALTGEGHGTDRAIQGVFGSNKVEIVFDKQSPCVHPNTMDFYAYKGEQLLEKRQVFSVGGGAILVAGEGFSHEQEIYPHNSFADIKQYCAKNNLRLWQYVIKYEGEQIVDYMQDIWQTMNNSICQGLQQEGVLPGGLNVVRRAKMLLNSKHKESAQTHEDRMVSAYAFAVGEQNASGGTIVTAPTCGASGVLPAVFRFSAEHHGFTQEDIIHGLLTAGLIGNLVKTNASISGAECGCQAEIGTACSMSAAGLAEMYNMNLDEIEYSAEVALEHHLGLTCDPVCGLVQIPCIERNAVAAMRAINAVSLATFLTESAKISFDTVVTAMYETGKDILESYRETSIGGLAKLYKKTC